MISSLLAGFLLEACTATDVPLLPLPSFDSQEIEYDADGHCYGRDITPAIIETVTEQVMVQAPIISTGGEVLSPAVFRTVTRQQIVRERSEVLFETICPPDLTPEFVASLQRALKIRGFYPGPISARMDLTTLLAIQRFQRQNGHDSTLLDIRTARELGLVAISQEALSQ